MRKNENEKFFKPPRLPPFTELYANISHLLDCDVFVRIVLCILRRQSQNSKLNTDGLILRALHLIGLALHEEQDDVDKNFNDSNQSYSFKFLEKSVLQNKKSNSFFIKSYKTEDNLIKLLTDLINMQNNEQFKLLAIWVNDYSQKLLKLKHKIDQQKSQTEASTSLEEEKVLKEKRKNEIAEKRRAKIMAQLNLQSKKFIETHQDYFEETKNTGVSSDIQIADTPMEVEQFIVEKIVCIGPKKQSKSVLDTKKVYQCILCQEEEKISLKSQPMVLCCYVQSSKVLSKNRSDIIEEFDKFDSLFMKNTLSWGINSTSCGHVMHADCWQKYLFL